MRSSNKYQYRVWPRFRISNTVLLGRHCACHNTNDCFEFVEHLALSFLKGYPQRQKFQSNKRYLGMLGARHWSFLRFQIVLVSGMLYTSSLPHSPALLLSTDILLIPRSLASDCFLLTDRLATVCFPSMVRDFSPPSSLDIFCQTCGTRALTYQLFNILLYGRYGML
jgi:hypothetical protein